MKQIVILGAGESGIGAAILAKVKGCDVFVSDGGKIADKYKTELTDNQIDFEEGKHSEERILSAKIVVKSPGIPDKAEIIKKIANKGISIVSEIEFAAQYSNAKIIGITGTNGKTTTTLLTYHLLKNAGLRVELGGNVGFSYAKLVAESDAQTDYYVLELSSFQLDGMFLSHLHGAILTNITPDHLDRYEYKFENYIASKFRILQNMQASDFFIFNNEDEVSAQYIKKMQITPKALAIDKAYFGEGVLNIKFDNKVFTFNNLPLRGVHNYQNMTAAILAALSLGISPEKIQSGLETFKNAPHRLEEVGTVNGILFVNDSKATNVDAAKYALGSFKNPIVWIAGGVDKGNDYGLIEDLVKKNVKALVCLGIDNQKLIKAFGETVSCVVESKSMEEAIEKAYQLADNKDVVLLAPACASFDLFRNYEDRGNQFRFIVHEKYLKNSKVL